MSNKHPRRTVPARRIRRAGLVDRLIEELSGPLCFVPESYEATRSAHDAALPGRAAPAVDDASP